MNPSTTDSVLELIAGERKRQIAKWGEQIHTNGQWLLILTEELGEASKALLTGNCLSGAEELIQAAAVLTAWIEDMLEAENISAEASSDGEATFHWEWRVQ